MISSRSLHLDFVASQDWDRNKEAKQQSRSADNTSYREDVLNAERVNDPSTDESPASYSKIEDGREKGHRYSLFFRA